MRRALLLLVSVLPLGSCATVMETYGHHVVYAEGHAWHTWPARAGVAVFATVVPLVLTPLLVVEVATGTELGFKTACASTALGAGVVLGTPTYLLGLPFASCAEETPEEPAPAAAASVPDDR